jgi:hypothetical protein
MSATSVDDELWNEFHRVVNMSAVALDEWLRIVTADPDWERAPDPRVMLTGQRVLCILRKRRENLTLSDIQVMRTVVEQVHTELGGGARPGSVRHLRLLSIGHDPLKAA